MNELEEGGNMLFTQSISSRSSDSSTMLLTMPVPGAAFMVTETSPKKM